MRRSRSRRWIGLMIGGALVMAACGGGEDDDDAVQEAVPPAAETEAFDDIVVAARDEGFVNVDWVTNETDVAELSALWAEDYPDIELRSRRDVSGPMAAIEEQEVAAGSAEFDVVMNADPAFLLGWQELDRQVDLTDQEFYATLPPEFQFGTFAENYVGPFTLAYNTDNVAEDEIPTSYEDLLEPEWAGRVGIADPVAGAGSTKVATYVLHEAYGIEFFEALAENEPVLYDNVLSGGEALAAGEVDAFIAGSSITVVQLGNQGAPLAIAPVDNSSPTIACFFIYSEAEEINAAKVFMNWIMTDPDALAYWNSTARITPDMYSPDTDFGTVSPVYEGLTGEQVVFPDLEAYVDAVDDGLMDDVASVLGF